MKFGVLFFYVFLAENLLMHKMEKQRKDWLYLFWIVEHYLYFFKVHANKN